MGETLLAGIFEEVRRLPGGGEEGLLERYVNFGSTYGISGALGGYIYNLQVLPKSHKCSRNSHTFPVDLPRPLQGVGVPLQKFPPVAFPPSRTSIQSTANVYVADLFTGVEQLPCFLFKGGEVDAVIAPPCLLAGKIQKLAGVAQLGEPEG